MEHFEELLSVERKFLSLLKDIDEWNLFFGNLNSSETERREGEGGSYLDKGIMGNK